MPPVKGKCSALYELLLEACCQEPCVREGNKFHECMEGKRLSERTITIFQRYSRCKMMMVRVRRRKCGTSLSSARARRVDGHMSACCVVKM